MADRRIRISRDKYDLVRDLLNNEDGKGPFRLQVDVLTFAAALGASRNDFSPVLEAAKEPIRREVFDRQGYDTIFDLLALHREKDPSVLANTDEMEDLRASIFEGYANGGLNYLKEELKGVVDYLDAIMLIIAERRKTVESGEEPTEFDLSSLLD